MKDHELDQLEALAGGLRDALPALYVGGDGEVYERDDAGLHHVPLSDLIRAIHAARADSEALYRRLHAEPRRAKARRAEQA